MRPAQPTLRGFLRHTALWRWLARVLRAPVANAAEDTAACGLGLDALPQGLGRLPVGTPVALAWQDRTADLLWAQALLHDLLQQGPVFLLAEDERSADPLLLQPQLAQACAQGRLRVWLMAPGLTLSKQPANLPAVWEEMERAGLTPQHALLVLASPRVHLGSSVAQVQRWGRQVGRWCLGRTRPVVFAFHAWDSAEQVTTPLHSLATVFQHVALLGSHAMHPLLLVDRWNGSEGPLFEVRFGLQIDPATQRLAYDGSQMAGQAGRLVEAPDQYSVIATEGAVAGQRGVPAAWQVVAQLSDVPDAARNAIAATVLLHSGLAARQEDLLRLVYQLRSQHGRTLKIVVHETQDKLRANLEQALLCLGANAVVYREVGFARLQRQLEELQEETFVRDIPADYALARAGFMPDAVRGYLPTLAFCDSVEAMLARTSAGNPALQHSFLRLSMQPHVAHLDAIQSCLALRDGDVLSADQNALYVFMFACSETDIDPALARLFSIPPSELFSAQTLFTSVDGMRSALRTLREAARKGVPDYSAYRSARAAPAQRGSASSAPTPGAAPAPAAAHLQDLVETGTRAEAVPAPTVHARALAPRLPPKPSGTRHAA
jgi:cellulose biosynthesis protein BcsE